MKNNNHVVTPEWLNQTYGLQLMRAQDAWDKLTASPFNSDLTQMFQDEIRRYSNTNYRFTEEFHLHQHASNIAKLFVACLPPILRCRIVAVPKDREVACISSNGNIIYLFEPSRLADPLSGKLECVYGRKSLLKKISPMELYQYARRTMRLGSINQATNGKRKKSDQQTTLQELTEEQAQALLAAIFSQQNGEDQPEVQPAWTPLILACVLIHEVLHLVLEHIKQGQQLREPLAQLIASNHGIPDPIAEHLANSVLNVFYDNEIHELATAIRGYITLAIRLREFEDETQGEMPTIIFTFHPDDMKDENENPYNKSQSTEGASFGNETNNSGDKNGKDNQPDQNNGQDGSGEVVLNEGFGNPKAAAVAERRRIAKALKDVSESSKSIVFDHLMSQLTEQWDREEYDPLNELVRQIIQCTIEDIGGLIRIPEDAVYPDPTERYLIGSGKLNRNLPARDELYGSAHVFAIVDSSGSMSDKEIVTCLSAITGLGHVYLSLAFCDTQPVFVLETQIVSVDTIKQTIAETGIPRGGTQLGNAIREAMKRKWWELHKPNLIVFLTDGWNDDWAINELTNEPNIKVGVVTTNRVPNLPKDWWCIKYERERSSGNDD